MSKVFRKSASSTVAVAATIAVVSAAGLPVRAQDAAQTPAPAAPQQPGQETPQPNAPTPPTPLPKDKPDTTRVGVSPKEVKATTLFQGHTPGQPLPSDPQAIRSLEDALNIAFQRSPSLLQAEEQAVRTEKTVEQILAIRRPQISTSVTYTRLANASSAFGGSGGGVTPSQIQNPFSVGLQTTPPGSVPVSLSGSSGGGTGSAGATAAGTTGQTGAASASSQTASSASATTRATSVSTTGNNASEGAATTRGRQTDDGEDDGDDDGGDQGGGGATTSSGSRLDQAVARISVSQLIDITGVTGAAAELGDLQKALSRLEIARLRQQLAFDVRSGYYNVLRAQAFVRVNEAAVAQTQELVRVTEAQVRAGVSSEFDLLRARTQLENNRQALISSRNQVAVSKNAFANTLGIDPSTPVAPEEVAQVPPMPELDEARLITVAYEQRPEYLQADTNILKSRKSTRLARRNLDPYLTASLSGNYNITEPALGNDKGTAAVALGLTVPLYDGGATRAAVEAARSDERGALIQKDQYARGIKAEVQQAIISIRDANERLSAVNATVGQARESLRLANVRFRAGVGTQLEINDAQTALTQSETNQVNAQYDYLTALARLQRAVGDPVTPTGQAATAPTVPATAAPAGTAPATP